MRDEILLVAPNKVTVFRLYFLLLYTHATSSITTIRLCFCLLTTLLRATNQIMITINSTGQNTPIDPIDTGSSTSKTLSAESFEQW